MILYHFAPAHMVSSILCEGLTKGATPIMKSKTLSFLENTQWLTTERDPKKQTWATNNLITYSRTDFRLTIEIPKSRGKRVVTVAEFFKDEDGGQDLVEGYEGSDKWRIYLGKIPRKWIVGCKDLRRKT